MFQSKMFQKLAAGSSSLHQHEDTGPLWRRSTSLKMSNIFLTFTLKILEVQQLLAATVPVWPCHWTSASDILSLPAAEQSGRSEKTQIKVDVAQ